MCCIFHTFRFDTLDLPLPCLLPGHLNFESVQGVVSVELLVTSVSLVDPPYSVYKAHAPA